MVRPYSAVAAAVVAVGDSSAGQSPLWHPVVVADFDSGAVGPGSDRRTIGLVGSGAD